MLRRFALIPLAVLLIAATAYAKQADQPAKSAQDALGAALTPMIDAHQGVVTAAFKHLKTGETYSHNAEKPLPSASLIKLPLLVAVYEAAARDALSLDEPIVLTDEEKVPGSGILTTHFSSGAELPLRDVVRLMIALSDNTATNLVIDALGRSAVEGDSPSDEEVTKAGLKACNDLMEKLGYNGIRVNSKTFRRDTTVSVDLSEKYGLGMMSAADTVALCERIVSGDPFAGAASVDQLEAFREEVLGHLRACESTSKVPRLLPEGTVVAHKTGSVANARCDAGVIESPTGPIAFCVMTAENKDKRWTEDAAPDTLIAQVGKAAFDYFTDGAGAVDAPRVARVLRMGQDDPLVEPLQRTLNHRLDPSPKLSIDGDFGPNTQKAVIRFQEQEKLDPTGDIDAATWKALGPLVMEDDPVPAPEVVMSDLPPLKEQDPLTGPPVVSCAAWAIADGETGKMLWGFNDSGVRDPASTTKTMTAYLVVKLAEKDPSILDEVITFSERADNTSGSTSGVRAGEQVSARELLYGLMLPSGNDASVAFAEHFGDRFPGEDDQPPYERFVAAMNAAAKDLGMSETGYRNTHGLTDEGHVTSARDLVKLAHAAMKSDLFREVVATRMYGTTLQSVTGYERNVAWKNTDQLLKYKGFYGVKTGTTGPAGACLISAGKRGDQPLYVVVLGATSGGNRYLDARNLYRWAWNELGVK